MLDVLLFLLERAKAGNLEFYDAPFLKTMVFQNVLVLESAADATIGRSPLPSLGWLSCCTASSKVKASFQPGGMVVVQTYTLDDRASLACAHDRGPGRSRCHTRSLGPLLGRTPTHIGNWLLGYEETRYGGYGLELLRTSSEQMSS